MLRADISILAEMKKIPNHQNYPVITTKSIFTGETTVRRNLAENDFVTEEDYLAREALADEKHEYLNGFVYQLHIDSITNMAGASDAHVKVTGNAHYLLKSHLRGSPCSLYMADMRVKVNNKDKAWFYPDVMVTCDPEDRQRNTMKHSPILVIEVLSPSTQDYDRGGKFAVYRSLSSLREYVLIDPTQYLVELFRLNQHQRWELFSFEGADSQIEFACIGFQCTLIELYEDVVFAE
jgi:Uma2 family endonuclease